MIDAKALEGHWRRNWIKAPGFYDDTTRVDWLQAPDGYVDMRLPSDLPDLTGVQALVELDTPTLASLMRSEGFAGTIKVVDAVCTWHRAINWHGTPQGPDVGAMRWDAAGHLIETGVHADYVEEWADMENSALHYRRLVSGNRQMHVCWSASGFLFGIGNPNAPATAPLIAALQAGQRPVAQLEEHFLGLFAMGEWEGATGIIRSATSPTMMGQDFPGPDSLAKGVFSTVRSDFHGTPLTEDWSD